MNNFEEIKIFDQTSLSDIFKQIHTENQKNKDQIESLIEGMKPYITSTGEAIMIIPLIRDLLDINIKNNEHLVKIATIAQKGQSNSESDSFINPDEIEDLVKQHQITSGKSQLLIEDSKKLIEQK